MHVKDVAKAQLLLFETPSASGRYLCTNGIYQFSDFAHKVSTLFPHYPVHRLVSVFLSLTLTLTLNPAHLNSSLILILSYTNKHTQDRKRTKFIKQKG